MITAVHISPDANASSAVGYLYLYGSISSQHSKYPEAVHIIAAVFNHVDLKVVFPKFHQHMKCATRGAIRQGPLKHKAGI